MSTVAVILAVDPGDGFETPKYLAEVGGRPLIQAVVADAATWPVDDVVVVLGPDADAVVDSADLGDATVIIDPGWQEGTASPIRAALDLITRDRSVDRILLARGDQPGVEEAVVRALLEEADEGGADAVIPKYRYARGWPVAIGPNLWDRFLSLEGELDVHDVITTHAASIDDVWVDHLSPHIISSVDDLTGRRG